MPSWPEAIFLVVAPFAPLFVRRVWRRAQRWLPGAVLAPGARPVTAAGRVMGLATARHFTNAPRGLHRATWSTRHGSRMLLGVRVTFLLPPEAPIGLGADDTVARRSGRKITATGCDRAAVRSTKQPVIHGVGLTWGSMLLLVPGPWSQRVGARPFVTALCWPAKPRRPRRHKTSGDGGRQLRKQGRRRRPGPQVVLVVDGGFAAVALALACVKPQVTRGARLRWEAARSPPPEPQPAGTRGPKPTKGPRHRCVPGGAERAAPPWEDVEGAW
jgi:hypothetical protein